MANYYYIVSGLPDLVLDSESREVITLNAFFQEMADVLPAEDYDLLPLLRFPADNKNIITLLTKRERDFDQGGNFDRETLENELKTFDRLPDYAQTFISNYRQGKGGDNRLKPEDQLSLAFYEEMLNSPNFFIREWFSFDLQLNNVQAALNCRKHKEDLEQNILDLDEISDQILKSSAPNFSLSSRLPWSEPLFQEEERSLTDLAKTSDNIRWEQIDEIPLDNVFSIDSVLGFAIKLQLTERWRALDTETGKKFLDKLINELESSYLKKETAAGGN